MNKTLIWGAVVVIALLAIVGGYYFGNSNSNVIVNNDGNTKIISISAERFNYTPGTITIKKGEHVKIVMNNKDTQHGIVIPDFNVKGIDSVEFTPDKAGTFEFHCPTFCGEGHREMKGTLIVEE